jgi:hypothetical protein
MAEYKKSCLPAHEVNGSLQLSSFYQSSQNHQLFEVQITAQVQWQ